MSATLASSGVARAAFDRLAPEYDALTGGDLFAGQRRRAHRAIARLLPPGCRVLEIGCGTGVDTLFMAERGLRVMACDPATAMLERAGARLLAAQLAGRVEWRPCGLEDLAAVLDAPDAGEFDGIVSNFGALNCVRGLEPLAQVARRRLRPGGSLLLGLINPWCLTEMLYFAGRRRWADVRRRRDGRAVPVAGVPVPTFYHRPADVRRALGDDFMVWRIHGLGVIAPPPYLEPRWRQLPRPVRRAVEIADAVAAALPPFNRLGDHLLIQIVRRRDGRP